MMEQLDVFKHVSSRLFTRLIFAPSGLLTLQELKEALLDGILMTIPPAPGTFQIAFA